MRDKQYLVAIRAEDRVLVMSTLFFADEVRDPVEQDDAQGGEVVDLLEALRASVDAATGKRIGRTSATAKKATAKKATAKKARKKASS